MEKVVIRQQSRYILELVDFLIYQLVAADFDQDGEVGLRDAINVLRYTVGKSLIGHAVAGKPTVDILDDALLILEQADLPEEDKDLFRQVLEQARDEVSVVLPTQFRLAPNFPNPFNASTTISYDVPTDGHITMAVYDVLGRQVAVLSDERHHAGSYQMVWNADRIGSGMYFLRMEAKGFQSVKRMTLLK